MSQPRVLVLDDNEAILEVVTQALIYENYEVKDIQHGTDFFAAVTSFKPDLILLDYHLSGVNGGDLCRQIKQMPAHRHIPVIIFSAYFNPGDAKAVTECDGFLYKPFDLEELFSIIHYHIPQELRRDQA